MATVTDAILVCNFKYYTLTNASFQINYIHMKLSWLLDLPQLHIIYIQLLNFKDPSVDKRLIREALKVSRA